MRGYLQVRLLREELQLLHEPGSYVGELVKVMGKNKLHVKLQPEGKIQYVPDCANAFNPNHIAESAF